MNFQHGIYSPQFNLNDQLLYKNFTHGFTNSGVPAGVVVTAPTVTYANFPAVGVFNPKQGSTSPILKVAAPPKTQSLPLVGASQMVCAEQNGITTEHTSFLPQSAFINNSENQVMFKTLVPPNYSTRANRSYRGNRSGNQVRFRQNNKFPYTGNYLTQANHPQNFYLAGGLQQDYQYPTHAINIHQYQGHAAQKNLPQQFLINQSMQPSFSPPTVAGSFYQAPIVTAGPQYQKNEISYDAMLQYGFAPPSDLGAFYQQTLMPSSSIYQTHENQFKKYETSVDSVMQPGSAAISVIGAVHRQMQPLLGLAVHPGTATFKRQEQPQVTPVSPHTNQTNEFQLKLSTLDPAGQPKSSANSSVGPLHQQQLPMAGEYQNQAQNIVHQQSQVSLGPTMQPGSGAVTTAGPIQHQQLSTLPGYQNQAQNIVPQQSQVSLGPTMQPGSGAIITTGPTQHQQLSVLPGYQPQAQTTSHQSTQVSLGLTMQPESGAVTTTGPTQHQQLSVLPGYQPQAQTTSHQSTQVSLGLTMQPESGAVTTSPVQDQQLSTLSGYQPQAQITFHQQRQVLLSPTMQPGYAATSAVVQPASVSHDQHQSP